MLQIEYWSLYFRSKRAGTLVIEGIKSIIQDIVDETTLNNYNPDFILFFTAKEEALDVSYTTGKIQRKTYRCNFSSFDELKN